MGFKFLPVMVLALLAGLGAIARDQAKAVLPDAGLTQSEHSGQAFLAYRDAVIAFQKDNPSFTGSASGSQLTSRGLAVTPQFLASAGNAITAFGTTGRTVTAFASLPAGAINAAIKESDGDASLGLASGATWTSYTSGTVVPLATTVPNGAVVSITQTGR